MILTKKESFAARYARFNIADTCSVDFQFTQVQVFCPCWICSRWLRQLDDHVSANSLPFFTMHYHNLGSANWPASPNFVFTEYRFRFVWWYVGKTDNESTRTFTWWHYEQQLIPQPCLYHHAGPHRYDTIITMNGNNCPTLDEKGVNGDEWRDLECPYIDSAIRLTEAYSHAQMRWWWMTTVKMTMRWEP